MKRDTREPMPESGADDFDRAILTLHEVADYLHCDYTTIFRLVRTGQLSGFRVGGSWRVRRVALDKWMAAGGSKVSGKRTSKAP